MSATLATHDPPRHHDNTQPPKTTGALPNVGILAGLIALPLYLFSAAVIYILYLVEIRNVRNALHDQQWRTVATAQQYANANFSAMGTDVMYLARHSLLRHWLDTNDDMARRRLEQDWLAFASYHGDYDQVRFIDNIGQEQVRVSRETGQPGIVAPPLLQDKSQRYYFKAAASLDPNALYVSPLDLNVEHEQIQVPLRPTLRIATPVVDSAGQRRGVFVLNYLADRLLSRVRSLASDGPSTLWLANGQGHWILGPTAADEWGMVLAERSDKKLSNDHPLLWPAMRAGAESGRLATGEALYTYARVTPAVEIATDGTNEKVALAPTLEQTLYVVGHLPQSTIDELTSPIAARLAAAYGFIALMLTGIAWLAAFYYRDKQTALQHFKQSEQRFQCLIMAAPDAVVVSDAQGVIRLINEQTERMFGYRESELLGKSIDVLVPERVARLHAEHRKKFIQHPTVRPMAERRELSARRKDGSEFPAAISLSPIETDDGLLVFSCVRDVSEQKAAERQVRELNRTLQSRNTELESLNRELDAFARSVSHDLRAPLRSVDGFTQALLEDHAREMSDAARNHAARIKAGVGRMNQLIEDLLRLSRIGRMELRKEPVDLSAVAADILKELAGNGSSRAVRLKIAPNLTAHGDRRLLRIALENILSNAWKFTSKRPDAAIEFGREVIDGTPAFFVRDNGAGFDMAYANKLFIPFQRLHSGDEFPGTGIGLSIVSRIIQKHGGRIWTDAALGKGATFYFTLPG